MRTKIRPTVLPCMLLAVLCLGAFWDVQFNEFVRFDDHDYVTENSHVRSGFSVQNLIWAFTSSHSFNWHPVTWLSHMLDVELFGLHPAGHHWNNLILHIANTLLLFLLLFKMSGALGRSAVAAALFAVHPLHVESVAWVSERKDVLSGLFWMAAILAYLDYAKKPEWKRLCLALVFFALGLMAKPVVVTLPFVLLLLDFWPLQRFSSSGSNEAKPWVVFLRLCREKIPFFALSAVVSIITFVVQGRSGAIVSELSLGARLSNALVSYVRYILKMFWPADLSCFYPHPVNLPVWQIIGSFLLLSGITLFAVRTREKHPYLLFGWLWYLGTLVPMIGLVQVGEQAIADRYTYIPLIGLFLMLCWGIPLVAGRIALPRRIAWAMIALPLVVLLLCSREQVNYWRDSLSLFEHEVQVGRESFRAHFHLAMALEERGRFDEAAEHYSEAIRIRPWFQLGHYHLGNLLARSGKYSESLIHYSKAIEMDPRDYKSHNNMGFVLLKEGRYKEAAHHFSEAVRIHPEDRGASYNLDLALRRLRESDKPTGPAPPDEESRGAE